MTSEKRHDFLSFGGKEGSQVDNDKTEISNSSVVGQVRFFR